MSCKCMDVIRIMDKMFPERYAQSWDNVGLMVGDPAIEVHKVLLALDMSDAVVEEAVRIGAEMIITHHPLLFHALKRVDTSCGIGKIIANLNKNDIALYSAHTNMDVAEGGVNHALAEALGLKNKRVLDKVYSQEYAKLVVFVPIGYERPVLDAITDMGAGWIGNYSHCTFRTEGLGTFKPLEKAHPFIGRPGNIEEVREVRIETIVRRQQLDAVISAMLQAHPYEEVAYDVYPLDNEIETVGLGIIGSVHEAMPLSEYVSYVKERLNVPVVKVVGRIDKIIRAVAVCGGSGKDLVDKAISAQADVFITGDIGYHDALKIKESGLALIDAGHYSTEHLIIPRLASSLQEALEALQYNIEVVISKEDSDPFAFL